jgi:hypothetical protein
VTNNNNGALAALGQFGARGCRPSSCRCLHNCKLDLVACDARNASFWRTQAVTTAYTVYITAAHYIGYIGPVMFPAFAEPNTVTVFNNWSKPSPACVRNINGIFGIFGLPITRGSGAAAAFADSAIIVISITGGTAAAANDTDFTF